MHLGRKYSFTQFVGWTRREVFYLIGWSLVVTLFLHVTRWDFLTVPTPVLTIIGAALAIILGFKNQQCYARFNEALSLAGQLSTNSLILAHRLTSMVGKLEVMSSGGGLRSMFLRHLAWLTALRFFLREKKPWENLTERGNVRFLASLPTPESQSTLEDELRKYLPEEDVQKAINYRADRLDLILRWQYEAIADLYNRKLITEYMLQMLTSALDDLVRLQGALKRTKNYPYARNYYSIAVILIAIFVMMVPFGLFPYARELGQYAGIENWTAWLNVPLSAIVGWTFVSLEKVGENSSNPFEGGANDVPISSIVRRVEIELRNMLDEDTDLKPIEAKANILF